MKKILNFIISFFIGISIAYGGDVFIKNRKGYGKSHEVAHKGGGLLKNKKVLLSRNLKTLTTTTGGIVAKIWFCYNPENYNYYFISVVLGEGYTEEKKYNLAHPDVLDEYIIYSPLKEKIVDIKRENKKFNIYLLPGVILIPEGYYIKCPYSKKLEENIENVNNNLKEYMQNRKKVEGLKELISELDEFATNFKTLADKIKNNLSDYKETLETDGKAKRDEVVSYLSDLNENLKKYQCIKSHTVTCVVGNHTDYCTVCDKYGWVSHKSDVVSKLDNYLSVVDNEKENVESLLDELSESKKDLDEIVNSIEGTLLEMEKTLTELKLNTPQNLNYINDMKYYSKQIVNSYKKIFQNYSSLKENLSDYDSISTSVDTKTEANNVIGKIDNYKNTLKGGIDKISSVLKDLDDEINSYKTALNNLKDNLKEYLDSSKNPQEYFEYLKKRYGAVDLLCIPVKIVRKNYELEMPEMTFLSPDIVIKRGK